MDVDLAPPLPAFGSKRSPTSSPTSSSSEKRAKFLLPPAQQNALNEEMKTLAAAVVAVSYAEWQK
jgi:hypothetical protein